MIADAVRTCRLDATRDAQRGRRAPLPFLLFGLVLAAALFFGGRPAMAYDPPEASLVIDAVSGEVFHADRPNVQRHPASLTKMMTLYLLFQAIERGELALDSRMSVSSLAAGQPPTKLGLSAGSTIRVQDAINALIIGSANDVAVVVAEALGGSVSGFATMMTDEARRLGMSQTVFRNPHGLPDNAQVTTANDMALLVQRLIYGFPEYYHYFSQRSYRYAGATHRTHNRLLESYDGFDGLKTGYIRASGFNLAASAERGNLRVIAIVFGGESARERDAFVADLLDEAFASERGRYLVSNGRTSPYFEPPLPPRHPIRDTVLVALASSTPADPPAAAPAAAPPPAPARTMPEIMPGGPVEAAPVEAVPVEAVPVEAVPVETVESQAIAAIAAAAVEPEAVEVDTIEARAVEAASSAPIRIATDAPPPGRDSIDLPFSVGPSVPAIPFTPPLPVMRPAAPGHASASPAGDSAPDPDLAILPEAPEITGRASTPELASLDIGRAPAGTAPAVAPTSLGHPIDPATETPQGSAASPGMAARGRDGDAGWPVTDNGYRFSPGEITFDSWSIQVGAFQTLVDTENALASVGAVAPDALASATPTVMAAGEIYRARLTGFTDVEAARTACQRLTEAGTDCLTIAPGRVF